MDQVINSRRDPVNEPGLFFVPGAVMGERRGETCSVAGLQVSYLLHQLSFLRGVEQESDLLQSVSEIIVPLREVVIEDLVLQEQVFLSTTHLRKEDLEETPFFLNTGGVRRQGVSAEAREPVQLGEGVEAHSKDQGDEGDLSKNNPPEDRETHRPLLGGRSSRPVWRKLWRCANSLPFRS